MDRPPAGTADRAGAGAGDTAIGTKREYETAKQSIAEFEAALAGSDEPRGERDPLFHEALRASLEGELITRREQLAAYDARRRSNQRRRMRST